MSHSANPEVTFINEPAPPRKLAWQFSAKTTLIVAALVATVFGAIVVPLLFALIFAVLYLAASAVLMTSVFCSKGWFRAFSIGALVPHAAAYLFLVDGLRGPGELLFAIGCSVIASILVGGIAAITQGYLSRRGGLIRVPNVPLLKKWLTNN